MGRFIKVEPVALAAAISAIVALISAFSSHEVGWGVVSAATVAFCNFVARSLVTPVAAPNLPVGTYPTETELHYEGPGE